MGCVSDEISVECLLRVSVCGSLCECVRVGVFQWGVSECGWRQGGQRTKLEGRYWIVGV